MALSDTAAAVLGGFLGFATWAYLWFFVFTDPCSASFSRVGGEAVFRVNFTTCEQPLSEQIDAIKAGFGLSSRYVRMFDERGERVNIRSAVAKDLNGKLTYVLHPGEHFVWPTVDRGHVVAKLALAHGQTPVRLQALFVHPRVFLVDGLLSRAEVEQLVEHVESNVALDASRAGPDADGHSSQRQSSTGWLAPGSLALVDALDRRIFELLRIPRESWLDEPMQVVKYTEGGQYMCHWDTFGGVSGSGLDDDARACDRFVTVLVYLRSPDEGGETAFCYIRDDNQLFRPVASTREARGNCTGAAKFAPKPGQALLFYSGEAPDNISALTRDPLSYHAGCPVVRGEKLVINKWVRNRRCGGGEGLARPELARSDDLYVPQASAGAALP